MTHALEPSIVNTLENPGKLHLSAAVAAFTGWYLLLFFAPFSTAGANAGMGLVLVASLFAAPRIWRDVRHQPIFWLSVIFSLYITARSLLAISAWPELGDTNNPHWTHFLRMSGLIAVLMAWWLYRYPRHLGPLLSVAIAGLVAGTLYAGHIGNILSLDVFHRWVWGYQPNYLGFVSGAAFLGLLAWLVYPSRGRVLRPAWVAALPLMFLMGLMLYTSQSRAAWLGFVGGMAVLVALGCYCAKSPVHRRILLAACGVACVGAVVLFLMGYGDTLIARLSAERGTLSLIVSGDLASAVEARQSVGYRLAMWLHGLGAFVEKPFFGWGVGAGAVLLDEASVGKDFPHHHNLYVEILVSLGLVGAVLVAGFVGLLARGVRDAARFELISPAYVVGLAAIAVHAAVVLFFAIRIGQTEGRAALTLLMVVCIVAVFRVGDYRRSLGAK